MELLNIIRALNKIKNGAFTRIGYITEVRMNADFKNKGYRMLKVTETTVRFGLNYGNIKSVIEQNSKNKAEGKVKKPRANNNIDLIKNKLVFNTNTQKAYVNAFYAKNNNVKNRYILVNVSNDVPYLIPITSDSYKNIWEEYIINSLKNTNEPPVFQINTSNIFRIGNYGSEITDEQIEKYVIENYSR